MPMKRYAPLFISLALAGTVQAQTGGMQGLDIKADKGAQKSQAKSHHAIGVVKSVDADKGTVSIDHEAVGSMNWPAMTMRFKAKDKKMLQSVKSGAKVEFDFEQR